MPSTIGQVQFFPWDGGSIFVGRSGQVPAHAHQAIQVCLSFDRTIRLRPDDGAPWADYDLAVVPSRQRHALDGSTADLGAVIFVEPETREGRLLAERFPAGRIAVADRQAIAPLLPGLRAAVLDGGGRDAVVSATRRLVQALAGDVEPAIVSDPRIVRAVAYINANLAKSLTLGEVAAVVHLSPGRFRHLFAQQTGLGLRQYILWRRFLGVWEHTMRGESLATAAHAAGFADSAHLTRTCRRMMGLPPSALDLSARPGAGA